MNHLILPKGRLSPGIRLSALADRTLPMPCHEGVSSHANPLRRINRGFSIEWHQSKRDVRQQKEPA
jgi:hypothetical protein